ncbi:MAG: DUF72 domain-containing protein [Verrucomicrobiota bacterium]|nr:DUF72 domain-containing protein [Limisphaera sp.]MDW8382299.1 DUF72 domain-containing protein [Verrucomicrobiota bacterium]
MPERGAQSARSMLGAHVLKVGCCGFAGRQSDYFQTFRLVEIQQTFYEPPRVETARRWRAMAPPDFEFTLKAWQLITHTPESPTYRRLRMPLGPEQRRQCGHFQDSPIVHTAWVRTVEVARALQATRIIFQCPARFTPTVDHVRQLQRFFRSVDRAGLDLVWEPRGMWPTDLVRDLCVELGLTHAVDPFRGPCLAGEVPYYRLHGIGGYAHRFRDEELDELKGRVGRGPAYVLFNNVSMKEDALRFLNRL